MQLLIYDRTLHYLNLILRIYVHRKEHKDLTQYLSLKYDYKVNFYSMIEITKMFHIMCSSPELHNSL